MARKKPKDGLFNGDTSASGGDSGTVPFPGSAGASGPAGVRRDVADIPPDLRDPALMPADASESNLGPDEPVVLRNGHIQFRGTIYDPDEMEFILVTGTGGRPHTRFNPIHKAMIVKLLARGYGRWDCCRLFRTTITVFQRECQCDPDFAGDVRVADKSRGDRVRRFLFNLTQTNDLAAIATFTHDEDRTAKRISGMKFKREELELRKRELALAERNFEAKHGGRGSDDGPDFSVLTSYEAERYDALRDAILAGRKLGAHEYEELGRLTAKLASPAAGQPAASQPKALEYAGTANGR